jgi:hypothetical protein
MLLRLQEVALKLCLDPLKLLLGSIASDGGESSSRGAYLRALGFGLCGAKSDEHGLLFIGLLVLTHTGCRVLSFLSLNQTRSRLRWKDLERGKKSSSFRYGYPDSRLG